MILLAVCSSSNFSIGSDQTSKYRSGPQEIKSDRFRPDPQDGGEDDNFRSDMPANLIMQEKGVMNSSFS